MLDLWIDVGKTSVHHYLFTVYQYNCSKYYVFFQCFQWRGRVRGLIAFLWSILISDMGYFTFLCKSVENSMKHLSISDFFLLPESDEADLSSHIDRDAI